MAKTTITLYVIKCWRGFFTGKYNHFVEPLFDERITGGYWFHDKDLASTVLDLMNRAIEGRELESHFSQIEIIEFQLTK